MKIALTKAGIDDIELIHRLQVESFMPLLKKYQDYDTNPGNEPIEKIINRMSQTFTDYYLIYLSHEPIGGIRIIKKEYNIYRISPVFIIPMHQGKGIAQRVFHLIERIYNDAQAFELDTILQESGHCYLYEKLGYKKTGKTEKINNQMTLVYYKKDL